MPPGLARDALLDEVRNPNVNVGIVHSRSARVNKRRGI
jgi:hypothetical protein